MKVETARHKSSLCMELAGKGQEKQLHLSGGDVTYTMTFQLGYMCNFYYASATVIFACHPFVHACVPPSMDASMCLFGMLSL